MTQDYRKTLKRAGKAVVSTEGDLPTKQKPIPSANNVLEVTMPEKEASDTQDLKRKAKSFVELEITGSKGVKYKVAVPSGYANLVPRVWEWTQQRYECADMISEGTIPYQEIADAVGIHRTTIYGWLEHPEFRDHVNALVMETGFANKRERIARLSGLSSRLLKKLVNELDSVKLTDKSLGAVLSAIGQYSKHLAQEKEEFVEATKVDQTTNISGAIGVAQVELDSLLDGKTAEERKALEDEFNKMGDAIIRGLTGG